VTSVVKLGSYLHLVQRFRMHGATPPLHPHDFMVCAGRTSLLGHTMVHVVSCWLLTTEAWVGFRPIDVGFMVGRVAVGQDFLWILWFSFPIISSVLHTPSLIHNQCYVILAIANIVTKKPIKLISKFQTVCFDCNVQKLEIYHVSANDENRCHNPLIWDSNCCCILALM
jgi:hypothetical protein